MVCPGFVIEMLPAQLHMHFDESVRAGLPLIVTLVAPGVQGAVVTGMQGIGVSTPRAAAVADATVGLAIDWHIPKGMMFTIGMWSMIVAAGGPPAVTMFTGNTFSVPGAMPMLHCNIAPATT